ncbi:MAG: helix-turn-helix domain-containing protein [Sedimentisphaerales bacterium]|nr:helix-turn-helix domain-containing protein [Sedimentisphaerales bacterium]
MAGMFYSSKEVSEKLGKSEADIRELVKLGRLREFRDGPNLLFKVDEVNALMSDTSAMGIKKEEEQPAEQAAQTEAEAEEILLAPETPEKPAGEEIQLTDADTQIVEEGIKVLGETDTVSSLKESGDETFGLGDTKSATPASPAKEASLEEIEKDVSLDTFGSGSGLLDLSLQADDTSLGGILDEIYTTGADGKPAEVAKEATGAAPSTEDSALEVAAEADQLLSEAQFPETPVAPAMSPAVMAQAYAEVPPDSLSNALGVMLIIPLLAVIYTAIVTLAAFSENGMPSMLSIVKSVQGFIWYIAIGMAVASGAIVGVGAMMGGEKKPKAPKAPKPPKVKKQKPPKPVKEKKSK